MKPVSPLITLATEFVLLSLLAVGGANAVIPEIQRVAVDQHHWLTNTQFVELFAIAQAVLVLPFQVGKRTWATPRVTAVAGISCITSRAFRALWSQRPPCARRPAC